MVSKRNKTKKYLLLILIIAILAMSVIYAVMSSELIIRGTGLVTTSDWGIRFENLQLVALTGVAQETSTPTIQEETKIGDYRIVLKRPGDGATYNFDVHNYGSINAVIETLNISTPVCTGTAVDDEQKIKDAQIVSENLSYTLQYSDGTELKVGDSLKAREIKSLILKLKFDGDELPSEAVEISGLGISIIYAQDTTGGADEPVEPLPESTDIYATLYTDGTLGFSNNTEK